LKLITQKLSWNVIG